MVDDGSGNYYIADTSNNRMRRVDSSGTIISSNPAAQFNMPRGVAVDYSGNLYIADTENHRVREVPFVEGTSTIVVGTGTGGFSGDGGLASAARLSLPHDVAVDGSGNFYIADYNNHRIRKVDSSGVITTIAGTGEAGFSGDGDSAIAAQLDNPPWRGGGRLGQRLHRRFGQQPDPQADAVAAFAAAAAATTAAATTVAAVTATTSASVTPPTTAATSSAAEPASHGDAFVRAV